jgi:hypothetical protein
MQADMNWPFQTFRTFYITCCCDTVVIRMDSEEQGSLFISKA